MRMSSETNYSEKTGNSKSLEMVQKGDDAYKETANKTTVSSRKTTASPEMTTTCSMENSRENRVSVTSLWETFHDPADEALYRIYRKRQKFGVMPAFVASTVIYLIISVTTEAVFYTDEKLSRIIVFSTFCVVAVCVMISISCVTPGETLTSCVVVLQWVLMTSVLLYDAGSSSLRHVLSDVVGWLVVTLFTMFVVFPWGVGWCVAASVMVGVGHSVTVGILHDDHITRLTEQLVANCLLYLAAILLGVLVFAFMDRKLRRSLMETKASLSVSGTIEKEYKEQERLLLSVLPRHVAEAMVRDMGTDIGGQFRKIYMSRHENVSILFADIVGFTAISSSVSAAELVKILNELFASFDTLANKYHQHRIKILGDCYYCVCGALEPRSDHAVLSIHMGLAMVDAIREVRRKTEKDVNMRVGIHTGAVLGGVLGQRQWQFDVLGKEVTLANKMESGGLPARVHISEATKQQLNGEFELEPGHGGDREDYLRLQGIITYLVKAVLKPFPEGTLDAGLSAPAKKTLSDDESDDNADEELDEARASEPSFHDNGRERRRNDWRLKQALLDKVRDRDLQEKGHPVGLWFRDSTMEARYQNRREQFSGFSMAGLSLLLLLAVVAKLCVMPRTLTTIFIFVSGELILVCMTTVSMAIVLSLKFPAAVTQFAHALDERRVARALWGLSAILVIFLVDVVEIVQCDVSDASSNATVISGVLDPSDSRCLYPTYFVHVAYLVLVGVASLVQLDHVIKFFVILACTAIYSVLHMVAYGSLFDRYDTLVQQRDDDVMPSRYRLSAQLMAAMIALLVLTRKMEETSRRLFLWREGAEKQREKAAELHQKNEALVYNLLPGHVARDFIGRRKRDNELYSHSYDEAGVIFAACPNFHDFYNESSVNNNGLECLRFLNEIISDYDELLALPRFQSIVKIKTVGPTYMAASGMVTSSNVKKEKSVLEKWRHLDDLVQFALCLKEELVKINQQSFNNFILRIGINHGPIIAGVIGARKPHYDIWGNTVNVASRMESTGLAGKIQVVEETKQILEEFGYIFEKRGLIKVKGKGELMTYFLVGQQTQDIPNQVSIA